MTNTGATVKGQVFVDVRVGKHTDTQLEEVQALIMPGNAEDDIKAIRSKFNGASRHGVCLNEKQLETRIKTLKEFPEHEKTVAQLETALKAVKHTSVENLKLGARVKQPAYKVETLAQ